MSLTFEGKAKFTELLLTFDQHMHNKGDQQNVLTGHTRNRGSETVDHKSPAALPTFRNDLQDKIQRWYCAITAQ